MKKLVRFIFNLITFTLTVVVTIILIAINLFMIPTQFIFYIPYWFYMWSFDKISYHYDKKLRYTNLFKDYWRAIILGYNNEYDVISSSNDAITSFNVINLWRKR